MVPRVERCEVCGFAWDEVARDEITPRVGAGTAKIADLLAGAPDRTDVRPSPQRWTATEYAAHVRDVLLNLRDRLVVGLIEDRPTFTAMYRDERVTMGLYRPDTADAVAGELRAASAMFVRLFDVIDPAELTRDVMYGVPTPVRRTLLWMGQQAVHEVEHHGQDIAENLGHAAG
jgi:hypothetical protein